MASFQDKQKRHKTIKTHYFCDGASSVILIQTLTLQLFPLCEVNLIQVFITKILSFFSFFIIHQCKNSLCTNRVYDCTKFITSIL